MRSRTVASRRCAVRRRPAHTGPMMPTDPTLLADLHLQAVHLTAVLARLTAARDTMLPEPSSIWRGSARGGFDSAIDGLIRTVDAGIAAIASARDHTLVAARVVAARG